MEREYFGCIRVKVVFQGFLAALLLIPGFASAQPDPPFSDTVGTVFDIIRMEDPSAFVCLRYDGRGARQIWDKRVDGEPVVEAYLFTARYSDGAVIEFALNPEFGTVATARAEALRYAPALGQLPGSLRAGIARFNVHGGDKAPHAGTGSITFYSETTTQRLGYRHLEESLFHEAVHASWDAAHRLAPAWIAAQTADGRFLTDYGQRRPEREDLAETALFAFALSHHPDRFPPVDSADTRAAVPHRLAYIAALLPMDQPLWTAQTAPVSCAPDADG